jgi:hypothetical protein
MVIIIQYGAGNQNLLLHINALQYCWNTDKNKFFFSDNMPHNCFYNNFALLMHHKLVFYRSFNLVWLKYKCVFSE